MKAFVLAVLVLAVTAGFIWWNSWYVGRLCDGILVILEDMADLGMRDLAGFGAAYRKMEAEWRKGEMSLRILVGHDVAELVKELFVEMGMRYIGQDELGYQVAREKLSMQVEKIRDGERVSIDSIL